MTPKERTAIAYRAGEQAASSVRTAVNDLLSPHDNHDYLQMTEDQLAYMGWTDVNVAVLCSTCRKAMTLTYKVRRAIVGAPR